MLIFVIPAIYPYKDSPQLGIYVQEQCEAIKKNYNHQFVVLNASTRNYKEWNISDDTDCEEDSVGTVYTRLTKGIMQSKLPRFAVYTYKKNVFKLYKEAVKEYGKPDVIYAHFSFPSGYCASLISKKYGIPFVVDEHYSLYIQNKIHPYIAKITKKTIETSAAFICVSERLRDSIYKHTNLETGIHVIPNLINDRYNYRPKMDKDKFIFFAAGNLYKSKNFDLLIKAFSKAFSANDKVQLLIGGDGPQKDSLISLIEEFDREKQIKMLGRLNSDQMLEYYEECNCFSLFSEYETFGIVYREALAVGRPVISAKNGGIEENWCSKYGILIDNNTVDCAAQALLDMYENNNKYDFKEISKICRERYSAENISSLINNILCNAKFS